MANSRVLGDKQTCSTYYGTYLVPRCVPRTLDRPQRLATQSSLVPVTAQPQHCTAPAIDLAAEHRTMACLQFRASPDSSPNPIAHGIPRLLRHPRPILSSSSVSCACVQQLRARHTSAKRQQAALLLRVFRLLGKDGLGCTAAGTRREKERERERECVCV